MFEGQKISVVIPTLNEVRGIQRTLDSIPKVVDEVIVVDGNSSDGTREIAGEYGAKVVLEPRRGYGRAFKTGFEHCTGDIIATTDGDGTYPIELLPEIIRFLMSDRLDFVSCSRLPLQDVKSMEWTNYIGNSLMTKAASVLWLHSFLDILSGMWVFQKSCLSKLALYSDSWNFSEEIKLQAYMKLGAQFAEYPIPYRERLGDTKLIPWRVGIENVGYLLALRTGIVSMLHHFFAQYTVPRSS